MSQDEEKRAAEMAKQLYDRIAEVINEMQEKQLGHLDVESEAFDTEKHLWGKGLLAALAQHLGTIEAALVVGDGLEYDDVHQVREMWIRAGHKIFGEAAEAARADEEEN